MFLTPFHVAEQHSKERISDSAERQRLSDVARSLRAAQGIPLKAEQVIGCTFFWFVFFMQVKKMNVKKFKILYSLYMCTPLYLSPIYL
jgi:hypothetical protein